MFKNLNAEIARSGITRSDLAKAMNISQSTLSLKLNGKSVITLKEAVEIKQILNINIPIEELFRAS